MKYWQLTQPLNEDSVIIEWEGDLAVPCRPIDPLPHLVCPFVSCALGLRGGPSLMQEHRSPLSSV